MRKTLFTLSVIAILQTAPHITYAAATTGTLSSTLTIISGCYINDGTGAGSLSNLGTINFGSVVALSSVINVAFSGTQSALRRNYAIRSADYGEMVASGVVRYGTTPWLTLEGRGEMVIPPFLTEVISRIRSCVEYAASA